MNLNLVAAQEQKAKLTKLDDSLRELERPVDFAALAGADKIKSGTRRTSAIPH